jgi:hypothetical protein
MDTFKIPYGHLYKNIRTEMKICPYKNLNTSIRKFIEGYTYFSSPPKTFEFGKITPLKFHDYENYFSLLQKFIFITTEIYFCYHENIFPLL